MLQVGNKSYGLEALMKYLGLTPSGVRVSAIILSFLWRVRECLLQWLQATALLGS